MTQPAKAAPRGYHHGDLRNALVAAAAELAREGGPAAVTVRAAARAVGVTATAAYRHFASQEELAQEAKLDALVQLGAAMRRDVEALPEDADPLRRALARFVAVGRAYIAFAASEPGLFRTAFAQGGAVLEAVSQPAPTDAAQTFWLLRDALDGLTQVGYLAREQRPMAELPAWSSVHGLSMLLIEGPMADAAEEVKQQAIARTLTVLIRGLGPARLSAEEDAALAAVTG